MKQNNMPRLGHEVLLSGPNSLLAGELVLSVCTGSLVMYSGMLVSPFLWVLKEQTSKENDLKAG